VAFHILFLRSDMDRKEQADVIEKALNSVIPEQEGWQEGDILVEWATIAYVTNPEIDKESAYPMFFSNGEIPVHRARGLFITALDLLDNEEDD